MKNVFFMFAIAFASVTFGQTLQAKSASGGGGFDVADGTPTGDVLSVDDEDFEIFTTASGSRYVKAVSPRSGDEYAVWVGSETQGTFEGRMVYESKSGAICVYKLTKSGFPYPQWLEVVE